MDIEFRNRQIERVCTDAAAAVRQYGLQIAAKIQQRINEIRAATSVEAMLSGNIGRCHPLRHDRKNQYAVDVGPRQRLIFEVQRGPGQTAHIQEIVDYHR